jgi:glycosyltransferase involved in cell wall biosynthesis
MTPCLKDVSLCAIVRDELTNPAGGIAHFVHKILPYVEAGVIVDTGSKDGTREELARLQKEYPRLAVYDRFFDGYANSRNYALDQVKTQYALVLDADERMTQESLALLAKSMDDTPASSYFLPFVDIKPGNRRSEGWGTNPRLFRVDSGIRYDADVWELPINVYGIVMTTAEILHYRPTGKGSDARGEWYALFRNGVVDWTTLPAPSDLPAFKRWKRPHKQIL